jgi:hypothetical protein
MMDDLKPTEHFDKLYWSYNLPLQMSHQDNGDWRILNYMPRKQSCASLDDEPITSEELKLVCTNTANILRNLANLFEALGRNEIDHIYYPDQSLKEAIKEFQDKQTSK